MSDKNSQVYRDQLDDNVIEMLKEDIGDNYSLRTENQRTIVAALNEINGKDIVSKAVGDPLLSTDTFADMGEKIDDLTADFKAKLLGLGVGVSTTDKFRSLINKLNDIVAGEGNDGGNDLLFELLKEVLEDEGVNVTEEDDMASLIIKVDGKFDKMKQDLATLLSNKGIVVDSYDWETLLGYITLFEDYKAPSPNIRYIYNNGTENESFGVIGSANGITFDKNADHLFVQIPQTRTDYTIVLGTSLKFDLTDYANIVVRYYSSAGRFALGINKNQNNTGYAHVQYYVGENDYGVENTYKLNISDYNGEYYIIFDVDAASVYGGSIKFFEIYLEK